MPTTLQTLSIAYWKLDRVGPRSRSVAFRHREEPQVAPFAERMPALVDGFLEQREHTRTLELDVQRKNTVASAATGALYDGALRWAGAVVVDIPELDTVQLTARPDVVENVIAETRRIVALVDFHEQSTGSELSYGEALRADLGALIERADEAAAVAQAAMAALQQHRQVVRRAAVALYNEIVALRRVLRRVLGTSHRDYQKLRLRQLRREDLDEDDDDPIIVEVDAEDSVDVQPAEDDA